MKVAVEDLLHKEFTVEISDTGSLPEGYVIFGRDLADRTVEVVAPQSVMATIAKVCVMVDVTGAKNDFTVNSMYHAYDNRGIVINSEKNNITFSKEGTTVDIKVYPLKQVAFVYDIDKDKYPNAIITATSISRESIMVVGREEILSKIDAIKLDTSSLEITDDNSSYELSYTIKDLLPEGVLVYGEDKTVSIKVETDAIITKTFEVPVNDIAIKSLGDGLSAAHETTGILRYTLKGRKSILDSFQAEDNPLFVSTKNLAVGEYDLEVLMDLEEGIELEHPIYVKVKISEKDIPTEPPTTEPPTIETSSMETSTMGESSTGGESQTQETTTEAVVENTTNPEETESDSEEIQDIPVDGEVQ